MSFALVRGQDDELTVDDNSMSVLVGGKDTRIELASDGAGYCRGNTRMGTRRHTPQSDSFSLV